MNKIIETYSIKRFNTELVELKRLLGNNMVLLNGGAIHCYTLDLDLGFNRLPTDIDIATDLPLFEVKNILDKANVSNSIDTNPIELWGFRYTEPCVKANICGSEVLILNKSTILKPSGERFSIDFAKDLKHLRSNIYDVKIAGLEYLDLVKAFQSRPSPKSDLFDRKIIKSINGINPQIFDIVEYVRLKTTCLINS